MKKEIAFLFSLSLIMTSLTVCTEKTIDSSADEGQEVPQYEIAYCFQPHKGGIHQIYTIDEDGSNDRKVIDAQIGLNHQDCSADGKKYVAVGYVGADFSTWSIHTFDADGENLVRLTRKEGVWDSEPSWSPDGKRIAFTRIFPKENRREELWMMNSDGSDQHYIGIEGFASKWLPDGSRLIYASKRPDRYDIYTCAADGTDEEQLTDTDANELMPVYSPDGSRIAFCALTGEMDNPENIKTMEIYTMNPDGSGVLQLTDNDCCDGYPRWSPDGSRFVFSSDRQEAFKWEVYVMNADGTDVRRVTHSVPDVTSVNPVWKLK
jgi:TolB protein